MLLLEAILSVIQGEEPLEGAESSVSGCGGFTEAASSSGVDEETLSTPAPVDRSIIGPVSSPRGCRDALDQLDTHLNMSPALRAEARGSSEVNVNEKKQSDLESQQIRWFGVQSL